MALVVRPHEELSFLIHLRDHQREKEPSNGPVCCSNAVLTRPQADAPESALVSQAGGWNSFAPGKPLLVSVFIDRKLQSESRTQTHRYKRKIAKWTLSLASQIPVAANFVNHI